MTRREELQRRLPSRERIQAIIDMVKARPRPEETMASAQLVELRVDPAEVEAMIRARLVTSYGVLVRHHGFVDRMARRDPDGRFSPAVIDAWIAGDEPGRFDSEGDAAAHASALLAQFPAYEFVIAVERPLPTWFVAHPVDERDARPRRF